MVLQNFQCWCPSSLDISKARACCVGRVGFFSLFCVTS